MQENLSPLLREETHLCTCYCCHHTLLLVGVWSPGPVTVAVEGSFSVDALTISTKRLIVAFVHIWGKTCNSSWETVFVEHFWGATLITYRCTRAGCCHSRSPVDSSTRSLASCSHSDLSCRFHQQTINTRRYLQTREKKSLLSNTLTTGEKESLAISRGTKCIVFKWISNTEYSLIRVLPQSDHNLCSHRVCVNLNRTT